ncbi:uncharacterized protein [Notamacropus eugenii]|uniref:uncharacterized protein isoform X1 n=1 Tax=Notamacropus eugenii TaxID=9315 RepID=UPI003B67D5DF
MLGSMVPPPLPPPPPPASPVQVLILPTSNQKDLGGGWEIKRWGYLKGETRCVPPPTEGAPSFLSGCGGLLAIPRNPISCEAPRKARGRDSCISRSGPLGSLPAPRILLLLPPQPEPEPSRSRAGARDCTPFPSAASQHRHPFPPVAFRGSIQAPGRRAEQRPSLVLGFGSGFACSRKPSWILSRWKTSLDLGSTCHNIQADSQGIIGQSCLSPSPHCQAG